jgi:hypothetical protein
MTGLMVCAARGHLTQLESLLRFEKDGTKINIDARVECGPMVIVPPPPPILCPMPSHCALLAHQVATDARACGRICAAQDSKRWESRQPSPHGCTAFMLACAEGQAACARALAQAGADWRANDEGSSSPQPPFLPRPTVPCLPAFPQQLPLLLQRPTPTPA